VNPDDFHPDHRENCRKMPENFWAFEPPRLPPKLELNWKLARLLSEADRAVAELSGAGGNLPNPHLLIRPYLRREAVLSSMIEDTHAKVDELVMLEADPDEPSPRDEVREVMNHLRALETGLKLMNEIPISGRLIRELHAILMSDVRGGESPKTPGEFRRSQNWIGPAGCTLNEARFVPPHPSSMPEHLAAWENYVHADSDEPELIKVALLHYQFECIHPFIDGNGRIGRLLITLFLCWRGCLSQPLLYLSGFFEEHRQEYYDRLLAVSLRGEWTEWLSYFLRGVRIQSQAALADTRRILDLYEAYRKVLRETKRVPGEASRILDQLFSAPMLSISAFAKQASVSYATVAKAVEFWQKRGLLTEVTGNQRNRLFVATELLRIMQAKRQVDVPETD